MTKTELKDIIKECIIEEGYVDNNASDDTLKNLIQEAVLLEMNAKKIDLEDMKDNVNYIKYIVNYIIKMLKCYDGILSEVMDRLSKAKERDEIKKIYNELVTDYYAAAREKSREYDEEKAGNYPFNNLSRVCKKFNIKFSDESMEVKKKIYKELDDTTNEVIDIVKGWFKITNVTGCAKKANKLLVIIDDATEIDKEYTNLLCNEIGGVLNVMADFSNAAFIDLAYVKGQLRINKEKSITYKLVNKLFKTKKK